MTCARIVFAALMLGVTVAWAAAESPPSSLQKAALAALDRAVAKFEALLVRDDDAKHRAATQAVFDDLKKRRDALRAGAFDQAKYDELRVDLNLEYQRLAAWMAAPVTVAPREKKASAGAK